MTQGHYPRHSMSMYASKDDMLKAVMKENEELHAQLVAEAARTAEQKLRADQMTQQHAMQAKMHARASAQLAAVQQGVQPAFYAVLSKDGESMMHLHPAIAERDRAEHEKVGRTLLPLYTHPTQQGLDARKWLQQHDFEALERFAETSEDDESYDIGKEAIQRLTHFGCLNSHGFGRYSITAFGSYVLDNWSLARELPFKMQSERDAEHRAAIAAQAKQGE